MQVGVIGRHTGQAEVLARAGLSVVANDGQDDTAFSVLAEQLRHPRLIMLDLPSGAIVDRVIDAGYVALEPGDVVLDPTLSYWGDTLRRYRRMRHRALFYLDLAPVQAPTGSAVLIGGDRRGYDLVRHLFEAAPAAPTPVYAGGAGAAHFARSVRDGVVMALAQALDEARQLVEAYPNGPDAAAILAALWPETPIPAGDAAWLLDDAVRLQAAVPLIAQAVMLQAAQALDALRPDSSPERIHGFIDPETIL